MVFDVGWWGGGTCGGVIRIFKWGGGGSTGGGLVSWLVWFGGGRGHIDLCQSLVSFL